MAPFAVAPLPDWALVFMRIATILWLLALGCLAFAPAANASDLSDSVGVSSGVRLRAPIAPGIGTDLIAIRDPLGATVVRGDCAFDASRVSCSGFVCFSDPNHGSLPVSLGDSGQGTIGFGVGMPDGHNEYGPYTGVFVNYNGYGC
jgi:hypothetical protein